MKQMNWMIIVVILFSLWGITGCASKLTPEQKKAEIYRKHPGINFGPLVGYDGHKKEKN
jgi:hypothetical protein